MRVVFMGTPAFAVPSLDRLAEEHEVALVVTRPDRRRSRGAPPEPSPVKARALALGLDVLEPPAANDKEFLARLASLRPELAVVVAYGRILPPSVLGIPARGAVNVHASLLPRWRGAAPIARAILAGDGVTGVATMQMEQGLDTGPVLLERSCDIDPRDTTGSLTARLAALGAEVLGATLVALQQGTVTPRAQDETRVTWAPPMRREDGRIAWDDEAAGIDRRIRACLPWPVAEAGLKGEKVQILEAEAIAGEAPTGDATGPADAPESLVAGRVLEAGERVVVACGGGTRLSIRSLRLPGRRALTAREAVNGRIVALGDRLTGAPA